MSSYYDNLLKIYYEDTTQLASFVTKDDSIRFYHTVNNHIGKPAFLPTESHPYYEFMYVVQGTVQQIVESEEYIMNAGDCVLININQTHSIKTDMSTPREFFTFHFTKKAIPEIFNDFLDIIRPFDKSKTNHIIRKKDMENFKIKDLLYELEKNALSKDPYSLTVAKLNAIELLVELNKLIDSTTEFAEPLNVNPFIKKTTEFIDDRIFTKTTIQDVADHMFLNKYYLCHLFKKNMGISLNEYIIRKKIFKAKSLMEEGCTATSACFAVGFQTYTSFYTNYKRILGYTPGSSNA